MTKRRPQQENRPERDESTLRQRRLRSAIDKASDYHAARDTGSGDQDEEDDAVRPMEEWHDIVSQRIEDAMRQGLFENLSGRGKPLDLQRDPFLPDDQRMAVTLLRNNKLSPEWISERKAILAAIERMRAELRREATAMRTALRAAQDDVRRHSLCTEWRVWLGGWQERMEQLNRRILIQNLKQPVRHLEIYFLRLPDELARAGADPEWTKPT